MSFIDELKRLARPYEDEDEDQFEDDFTRLIDFLSGVAYANEGTIKKVALSTYIITPYNVEIMGDLIDELENNGLYF